MPENRHLRFLLRLLYAALALAGLWLCVRFLLPWLLPFLLAWGLAALLEPAVGLLMRRLRLPRWGAAALCTAALAAALLGLLALALWRAWYELTRLVSRLPVLLSGLPALAEKLEGWAYRFLVALPLPLQDAAREGLENLPARGPPCPAGSPRLWRRGPPDWPPPSPPPPSFSLPPSWPPILPAQAAPPCAPPSGG